ncbi:hypothetical protein BDZ45DRAFT_748220 [Acephala macrosclerotiorum]|nr:hypothetical protein BDZ45DRAFT_748220 [Acephala macrosclerotiorum]
MACHLVLIGIKFFLGPEGFDLQSGCSYNQLEFNIELSRNHYILIPSAARFFNLKSQKYDGTKLSNPIYNIINTSTSVTFQFSSKLVARNTGFWGHLHQLSSFDFNHSSDSSNYTIHKYNTNHFPCTINTTIALMPKYSTLHEHVTLCHNLSDELLDSGSYYA